MFFSRSYVDHRVNKRKKRLHFDLVVFCYNLLLMNSNRALKCNIIQSIETSQHNRIFIYSKRNSFITRTGQGGNIDFPVTPPPSDGFNVMTIPIIILLPPSIDCVKRGQWVHKGEGVEILLVFSAKSNLNFNDKQVLCLILIVYNLIVVVQNNNGD